ncbi:MAG: M23 family metallopeptidase, partial [Methylocystis sp.]|nr:M23 family metallopeptidase [Methylocystis sp.]
MVAEHDAGTDPLRGGGVPPEAMAFGDVALAAGTTVEAPAAGTVTFVGRVPSAHGGTVVACTIEIRDGSLVTLMPLTDVVVARGDPVAAGDTIGSLSASGDPSSPVDHVHVGMRRGELYVDPTPLLAAPPVPVAPGPEVEPTTATTSHADALLGDAPAAAPRPVAASAPDPMPIHEVPSPDGATATGRVGTPSSAEA